jgi:glycosyltransferase involved in cell wall biosynthesis
MVSVCMLAYNHEDYIAEAIEGVMMQQTNFEFELIISNDASSDRTHEVVSEFVANHTKDKTVKYFNQQRNLGMQCNFIFALNECKGKYIALCEGDDYWTDPLKLQKQVDYISSHENCNLVFTDVKLLDGEVTENKLRPNWANITKSTHEFKDLIERNVITTCTVLFRNAHENIEIQNWLKHFTIGDYPLYLLLLRSGYAYFLKDITAVYRQHTGGIFSLKGIEHLIDKNIEVLESMQKLNLSKEELFHVRKSLIKWYYTKVVRMSSNFHFDEIRPFIKGKMTWSDTRYNLKYFLKTVFLFSFPKFKAGVFEKPEMSLSN